MGESKPRCTEMMVGHTEAQPKEDGTVMDPAKRIGDRGYGRTGHQLTGLPLWSSYATTERCSTA